jgi:hypothetical protein
VALAWSESEIRRSSGSSSRQREAAAATSARRGIGGVVGERDVEVDADENALVVHV